MKTSLKIDGTMVLTGAAIIAAIGVTYLVKKKGAAVAGALGNVVTQGLNPASTENYVYKGINRMGEVVTGTTDWNLGSAVYNQTHLPNGDTNYLGSLGLGVLSPLAGGLYGISEISNFSNMDYSFLNKVNPASDQNLAYSGVNKIGSAVSGDDSWSLGTWIYDVTHPSETKKDYSDIINDGLTGDW